MGKKPQELAASPVMWSGGPGIHVPQSELSGGIQIITVQLEGEAMSMSLQHCWHHAQTQ